LTWEVVGTQLKQHELTVSALLAARARAASDGRLALDAGGGLIAASLALAIRPPAWPVLMAAATCFLAYGAWGIADRALQERASDAQATRLLRALRAAAAVLGVLGVVGVGGVIMGFVLGNWIH
jgi:hypothetical protein